MTKTDAAKVMAVLATAYRQELDESQMRLWFGSCLEHITASVGSEVAARIVRDDEWFPTPARFNEVRRAVERAHEPAVKALPPAPPQEGERERVRALIAQTRQVIRDAKPPVRRPARELEETA